MPNYKLTYFNRKGRAEPIRYLFAFSEKSYEDIRIEKDSWPPLRLSLPLGQLPVLEVDGESLPQSGAILRYLAEEFGCYGENSLERAKINIVLDTLKDFELEGRKVSREKNEEKKKEYLKEYLEGVLPRTFNFLEDMCQKNGGQFLVGRKISIADLMFFTHVNDYMAFIPDAKITQTALLALFERIKNTPAIAAWIKSRPSTPF